MERVAIISDIHGNLPALEAVFKHIRSLRIRRIVCLGDLAGKGPQPAEAVDRIRELCETVVQGNWDSGINKPQDKPAGIWQQEQLGADRLAYLRELPIAFEIEMSGKLVRLFHASAHSVYHRVLRKAPKKDKLELFETPEPAAGLIADRTPEVVIYGDIHIPYVQMMNSKSRKLHGLTLLNTGSVGLPYDGLPQACYTILEGTPGAAEAPLSLRLVRVPYDRDKAIEIAEKAGLPNLESYRYEVTTGLEWS